MLEKAGVPVMLNELSSTVVFERPRDEAFVRKWQLACEGDIAHVVVMPNIGLDKLETFVADLITNRASVAVEATRQMAQMARLREASIDEEEGTARSSISDEEGITRSNNDKERVV